MVTYKCVKCREEFEMEDRVRCPFCGFRILCKIRPKFPKRIVAK